jgi:hypothetical protein
MNSSVQWKGRLISGNRQRSSGNRDELVQKGSENPSSGFRRRHALAQLQQMREAIPGSPSLPVSPEIISCSTIVLAAPEPALRWSVDGGVTRVRRVIRTVAADCIRHASPPKNLMEC